MKDKFIKAFDVCWWLAVVLIITVQLITIAVPGLNPFFLFKYWWVSGIIGVSGLMRAWYGLLFEERR